jgi:hypothetical protein
MTSPTTKYTTPVFNINGTSRETVLEELHKTRKLLNKAIEALCAITCHPRDFQFSPEGAWAQADFEKSKAIADAFDALDWVDAWIMSAEEQDN